MTPRTTLSILAGLVAFFATMGSQVITIEPSPVTTVNDSTGAVTLTAGSGVSITPSNPATFTIAATGGSGEVDTLDVASVNDSTGAVTIAAGSGITVTPSSPATFTIAATGGGGESDTLDVYSINGRQGVVHLVPSTGVAIDSTNNTLEISTTLGTGIDSTEVATGALSLTDLNQSGATTDQVIGWNGSQWTNMAQSGGSGGWPGNTGPLWSDADTLVASIGPQSRYAWYSSWSDVWNSWGYRFKGDAYGSAVDVTHTTAFSIPQGMGSRDTVEVTILHTGLSTGNMPIRWGGAAMGVGDDMYGGSPYVAADTTLTTVNIPTASLWVETTAYIPLSSVSSTDTMFLLKMEHMKSRAAWTHTGGSYVWAAMRVRVY